MEKKSKRRAGRGVLQATPSQLILLEEYRALQTDYLNLVSGAKVAPQHLNN